ncbi:hypothetical protein JCM11641_005239 [Rhodosporidiobolus odoratus]
MVIRRVLLDAFGTVFSPREPVFRQYALVARQYGLQVEEQKVKDGFKLAFKKWAKDHPLYGKHSTPPLDPRAWWIGVIEQTFQEAGVPSHELDPVASSLSSALVERFHGKEGYDLHADALPFLSALASLPSPSSASSANAPLPFPPPGIVSNTDPSVSKVLRSLGVLFSGPQGGRGMIREEEVWTTWALESGEKKEGRFWEEVLRRLRETNGRQDLRAEEVLVVGDELDSDYLVPRSVGFKSLLLRRLSPDEEHPNASYEEERHDEGVEEVTSLMEVIEYIKRENARRVETI